MNRQLQIDHFVAQAHQLAVQRLREHPQRMGEAKAQLARWRTREKLYYIGEVTVICPEVHDLAVSKCVAGRDKDADFIRALFRHAMIELPVMMERIALLESTKHPVQHITQWTQRRAQEATE